MNFKVVSPILGFDTIKEITFVEVDEYFSKLEKEGISFTLVDPSKLREYSFEIPLFYKNLLGVEEGDDLCVYNMVILNSEITKSIINFSAPLILNHTKGLLVQVVLDSVSYPNFGLSESIADYL